MKSSGICSRFRIAVAVGIHVLKSFTKIQRKNTINQSIALGLAMVAASVVGATAPTGCMIRIMLRRRTLS